MIAPLLQVNEAQGLADWFSTASVAAVIALCGGLACWYLISEIRRARTAHDLEIEKKDKIIEALAERRRVSEEARLDDRTTWLESKAEDAVRIEGGVRTMVEAVEQQQRTTAEMRRELQDFITESRRGRRGSD